MLSGGGYPPPEAGPSFDNRPSEGHWIATVSTNEETVCHVQWVPALSYSVRSTVVEYVSPKTWCSVTATRRRVPRTVASIR